MGYVNEGNKVGQNMLSVIGTYYEIKNEVKMPVSRVDS